MNTVAAAVLVLTLLVGVVRAARGPTPGDRVLAVQLFGTTGVGVLAALAPSEPALLDAALVLAALAAVAPVTFTCCHPWRESEQEAPRA